MCTACVWSQMTYPPATRLPVCLRVNLATWAVHHIGCFQTLVSPSKKHEPFKVSYAPLIIKPPTHQASAPLIIMNLSTHQVPHSSSVAPLIKQVLYSSSESSIYHEPSQSSWTSPLIKCPTHHQQHHSSQQASHTSSDPLIMNHPTHHQKLHSSSATTSLDPKMVCNCSIVYFVAMQVQHNVRY